MQEEEQTRQTLNTVIKEMGLKDELKKHLRARLAERLQQPAEAPKMGNDLFRHRMVVSTIKEHLDKIGCVFASSVFCAESGYEEKLLERAQLKQLLNLPFLSDSQTILDYLFSKSAGSGPCLRNSEMQTDQEAGHMSLEQKFTLIDLEFRRVLQESAAPPVIKNSGEEQKKWYEKEVARFREFEAHKIKVRVGEEWRVKFQAYAAEMEAFYQRKLDKTRQKQKQLVEDLAHKEKALAQKIQGWESSARSRMELIQLKEATVLREKGNLQLERRKAEQALKQSIYQSRDKIKEYQSLILNVEKRIAYEVGLAKLSFEQEQVAREQQLKAKRKFVEEEYDKLMRIKDTLEFVSKDNARLLKENESIRTENQEIKKELKQVTANSRNKDERLESMKEEFYFAQNDKQKVENALESQRKLRKKREEELAATRKELDRLRSLQRDSQQSQSSFQVPKQRITKQLSTRIAQGREQRRRQIQRFRLQL